MSIETQYYTIIGYDLTNYKTEKYQDWRFSAEGSKFTNYHNQGFIQFFDDPMNEEYLYFGYILGCGDQYDFKTQKVDPMEVYLRRAEIDVLLSYFQSIGIINFNQYLKLPCQIIIFEECV